VTNGSVKGAIWRHSGSTLYLAPEPRVPSNWTVDPVAELLFPGWRLWAQVGCDRQSIATSTGHLVDAVHLASLVTPTTRFRAGRKIGYVPPRRTRNVVAGPRDRIRTAFDRAQMRIDRLAVLISYAFDYRFLDTYSEKSIILLSSPLPLHLHVINMQTILVSMDNGRTYRQDTEHCIASSPIISSCKLRGRLWERRCSFRCRLVQVWWQFADLQLIVGSCDRKNSSADYWIGRQTLPPKARICETTAITHENLDQNK
jgi:hypothetical protein